MNVKDVLASITAQLKKMPKTVLLLVGIVGFGTILILISMCGGSGNDKNKDAGSASRTDTNGQISAPEVKVQLQETATSKAQCADGTIEEGTATSKLETTLRVNAEMEKFAAELKKQATAMADVNAKAKCAQHAAPPPTRQPATSSSSAPPSSTPAQQTQSPPPPTVTQATLFADLAADPPTGYAPLLAVTPVVTVSGTATGPITYSLDCGNGTLKRTVIQESTTWRGERLCDYLKPGEYTIRMQVDRKNLREIKYATVTVLP